MAERKKPVFGIISLALMLGLAVVGIVISSRQPPLDPVTGNESLSVIVGTVANIAATLIAIATVSLTSAILAWISFLRRESRGPAAISLCLSLSALTVVVLTVLQL